MKKGTNKFLNNSFTAYMRATMASPVGAKRSAGYVKETLVNVFSFMALLWLVAAAERSGGYAGNISVVISASVGAIFYANWIVTGISRRARPAPLGFVPIGWKRRVVYTYLSNLMYTIFTYIIITACVIALILFWALTILIISHYWILTNWSFEWIQFIGAGWRTQLFTMFTGLLFYGVGACISFVGNKKLRTALTISFPVLMHILLTILRSVISGGDYYYYVDILNDFENFQGNIGWLVAVIIASVASVALSVYLCIRNEKPSKI